MRVIPWTRDEYMGRVTVRPDGCWEWSGHHNNHGYPIASRTVDMGGRGHGIPAYRLGYELFVGPVPADLDCDHLCMRGWCANPYHVEPVTHRENIHRMPGLFGRRARATRCDRGHSDWRLDGDGRRRCSTCRREARVRREAA